MNAESISRGQSHYNACRHENMHQPSPQQNHSATADLSRTDRLQPGRGCTSQTSQRLHNPERAIQRFTVAGATVWSKRGMCSGADGQISTVSDRLVPQQQYGAVGLMLQAHRLLLLCSCYRLRSDATAPEVGFLFPSNL